MYRILLIERSQLNLLHIYKLSYLFVIDEVIIDLELARNFKLKGPLPGHCAQRSKDRCPFAGTVGHCLCIYFTFISFLSSTHDNSEV